MIRKNAGFVGTAAPALGACAILLGCGSTETGGGAASPAKPAPAVTRKAPGGDLSPNMVSAVSGARTGAARVQLKFELRERPAIAQPLDIDLAILPGSPNLDRIYGKVEAADGLELATGDQIAPTDKPVQGMPIRHSIRVLPKRDGIFTLNTIVSVDAAGQTSTQSFTIPVIVGAGLPEAPSKPTAAAPRPAAASR